MIEQRLGQNAEQRIPAARYAQSDGQDVIADERAARDHAHGGREELAGHQIAAAAGGKQFDDLRVAGADDDDGQHRGQRHEQAQVGVAFQRQKRLLRAVAGGRQAVRSQADPRQQGHERHVVENILVREVPCPANDQVLDPTDKIARIHRAPPNCWKSSECNARSEANPEDSVNLQDGQSRSIYGDTNARPGGAIKKPRIAPGLKRLCLDHFRRRQPMNPAAAVPASASVEGSGATVATPV